ncbi:hypothetical protein [Actinomyces trachealis]|uniref:hypothetical protein n=1 Tax=Actinomyces trachealis TaxID=2763540 RepID=UPI0018C82846|nr:hypothetical protein [Actinomyces trachealis]
MERVAAQIAQIDLKVTVLTDASPVEVDVTLGGQDLVAWHGAATETWTELGTVLRVERATGRALRLLDEPSSALDETTTRQLIAYLQDLVAQGTGVRVATHDPLVVEAVDRVLPLG